MEGPPHLLLLLLVLSLHQLPRRPLCCKIHLFHLTVQRYRSILVQRERTPAAVTRLQLLVRKANPLIAEPHHNLIDTNFNRRLLRSTNPMCRRIRLEQGSPRNPKLGVD